jgi:predicted lipoprotein
VAGRWRICPDCLQPDPGPPLKHDPRHVEGFIPPQSKDETRQGPQISTLLPFGRNKPRFIIMSNSADTISPAPRFLTRRVLLSAAAAVLVLGAMAVDTTVVRIGSENDQRKAAFSKEGYGAEQFPKVQADILKRAVPAAELAAAITADKAAASKKYGVATSVGPVLPVIIKGVVGERKGNMHVVQVEGLPPEIVVRVQTGPAINGTDLRDATGTILFGQFKNQIEYQDAGSAINNEMKKQELAGFDPATLTGKTVEITGVFKLINPKGWMITPAKVKVQ